jgi:hypothetical protein
MQSFARVAAIALVWNGGRRGGRRICFRVVPARALMRPASRLAMSAGAKELVVRRRRVAIAPYSGEGLA